MNKFLFLALLFPLVVNAADKRVANTKGLSEKPKEISAQKRAEDFTKKNDLRLEALKQVSFAEGIADGRVDFFKYWQNFMVTQRENFNKIYNVSNLYLENGKLQPPIVLSSEKLLQVSKDGQNYQTARKREQIVYPAKFVTQQIRWQDFIVNEDDLLSTNPPDQDLRPRTSTEERERAKYYTYGFNEGREQAKMEIEERFKSLSVIITGLRRGYQLMSNGSIKPPKTSKRYTPVAGNATEIQYAVSDYTIDSPAEFNFDMKKKRVFVGKHKSRKR